MEFFEQPQEGFSSGEEFWVRFGGGFELPEHFTQRDGLADGPGLGVVPICFFAPVFGFGDGLAVEFEDEFGMAGVEEGQRDGLVAGDAGVGADVEIFEVAHAGEDAIGLCVIGAGVGAEPVFGRAVATFAGDAFGDAETFAAERFGNIAQGCVAGNALLIGGGVFDLEGGADLFGARGGECGEGALMMKVARGPSEILILMRAGAAVAAGTCAGIGAEKFWARFGIRFGRDDGQEQLEKSESRDEAPLHRSVRSAY